jgi:hypothetical protein
MTAAEHGDAPDHDERVFGPGVRRCVDRPADVPALRRTLLRPRLTTTAGDCLDA